MFANLPLVRKILLTTAGLAVTGSLVTIAYVRYQVGRAELAESRQHADTIMERNLAIHRFYTDQLKPSLFRDLDLRGQDPDYFNPAWMSSTYAIREIESLYRGTGGDLYRYKECAVSARSPGNEADPFERDLLERMRREPALEEVVADRIFDGKPYHVFYRRGETMEAACMRCHSEPAAAPQQLIDHFGDQRSFHRQPGELASMLMIAIPQHDDLPLAGALTSAMLGIIGLLLFGTWWMSHRWVLAPVQRLHAHAERLMTDESFIGEQLGPLGGREMARLGEALDTLSARLYRQQHELEERVAARTRDLNTSRALLKAVFQTVPVGLALLDRRGLLRDVNAAYCQMLGYPRQQLLGTAVARLIPEPLRHTQQDEIAAFGNGELPASAEEVRTTRDGRQLDILLYRETVTTEEGEPLMLHALIDQTEKKGKERQLQHMATHDELTGLANRTLLYDRLEQSIHFARRSQRFVGVLFLDLDRFKVINDSLGHKAGDDLLCAVAERLRTGVREADTVGRLGGDEFVIVFAEVAAEEHLGLLVEKIASRLSEPYTLGERQVTATPSIGISVYPHDGDSSDLLLRKADTAMYRAKEERNTFRFYAPEMNQSVVDRLELEADLRLAIRRRELRLFYQPQVVASGRIIGCEALLRWEHPRKGLLAPGSFIQLAEETGLIVPIGEWVIATACAQIKEWSALGLPAIPVAVNLSARQFRRGDLFQMVQAHLQEHGIDPCLFELELTESMIMADPEATAESMAKFKAIGVRLTLDDFGTGYASLSYLRRFPFDCLKIDRSFIRDVPSDPGAAALTNTIVAIARTLGMGTVAEGVENRAQLDFLAGSGCDAYQGYLFSQPVPAADFLAMLEG